MRNKVKVAAAATFAYDALHASLAYIFQQALGGIAAELMWAPYGSWRAMLQRPPAPSDAPAVTLLFLRSVDVQHDHPELRHVAALPSTERLEEFLSLLSAHAANPVQHHVVVVLCPSPPDATSSALDDAYIRKHCPQGISLVSNVQELYDVADYYNATADLAMHSPYTPLMYHVLAVVAARQICRVFRVQKKVLVLDCDHTLWSGAIAEDGALSASVSLLDSVSVTTGLDKIEITPAHRAFQSFLIEQWAKGMLLCLCSRNIPSDVHRVFHEHPEMLLQLDTHIVTERINHSSKAENITAMLNELNLGADSVVFFDDNVVECHSVQSQCPSVTVVQVPLLPELTPEFGRTLWALDVPFGSTADIMTTEDMQRTAMYKQQLQARTILSDSVLASLGMHINIQMVDAATTEATLQRIVQLCQRTNQFNLQTQAARAFTTIDHVRALESILYATVTDRFGHYGLVGVAGWTTVTDTAVDVSLFLLSCRVLNRNVEHAMLQYVAKQCAASRVCLRLQPTIRNAPIATFLNQLVASVPTVLAQETAPHFVAYEFPRDKLLAIHEDAPALVTVAAAPSTGDVRGELGVPTVAFSTLAMIEKFFAPMDSVAMAVDATANVAKFRRQQRESVKVQAVTDTPIWTTNNITERRGCSQPSCSQEIPLVTPCTFERCRTCCYQVQKWLERAMNAPHPKARATATEQLLDAGIDVKATATSVCTMHTNPRRVGGR
ncbi:hypothetical protein ACHHYP_10307 [Achlya hypogyna]|uniref:FCP1 homology domain-containing protein n=1 Tax=Achlya hypogyna TaxID=1202772 RepID=A0A1V9YLQ7_ACHHY|nr:hypothetical protein ACHHYP_10307 [Achlya hypogyna]